MAHEREIHVYMIYVGRATSTRKKCLFLLFRVSYWYRKEMVLNEGKQLSSIHLGHFCKTRPFYVDRWMFLFEVEQKENC